MHDNLEPVLNMGITLAILRVSGNIPVEKDWLNKFARSGEICVLISFKIMVGMLLGPQLFDSSMHDIRSETSVLSVGLIKKEFPFSFFKYVVKFLLLGRIFSLSLSLIDVKKLLNSFAMSEGLVIVASFDIIQDGENCVFFFLCLLCCLFLSRLISHCFCYHQKISCSN